MLRPTRIRLIALFLCLGLALAPAAAFAASATATSTAAAAGPTDAGNPATSVEVQLWPSEIDGSSLIVSAEVPADAKLPYTLRLPMPAGITVTWCGEIFGGTAAQDKEVPYTIVDGRGGKALVMTLTTSRVAQYEGTLAAPVQAGARTETTLDWIQSAPSGEQHFAVKLANTAGDPQFAPAYAGAPQQNEGGERLYSFAPQQLALGSDFKLKVSWTTVAAGSQARPSTSSSGTVVFDIILIVLVVALVAAVIGLAVVVRGQRRVTGPDTSDLDTQEMAASAASRRRRTASEGEAAKPQEEKEPEPDSDDPFDALD
jgi:hypothetical protein